MNETTESKNIMHALPGGLEMCIDCDHITIPIPRFEDLIKKEAQLELLLDLRSRMKYDSNYVDVVDAMRFLVGNGGMSEENSNAE